MRDNHAIPNPKDNSTTEHGQNGPGANWIGQRQGRTRIVRDLDINSFLQGGVNSTSRDRLCRLGRGWGRGWNWCFKHGVLLSRLLKHGFEEGNQSESTMASETGLLLEYDIFVSQSEEHPICDFNIG